MRRTFAAIAATLIGLVGITMLITPSAQAVTDHPVVKPAVFKSSNDVAVQVGDAVPDGWHIPAVITDTDDRLGPPPDFHFSQCSAHPNWGCIKVIKVTSGAYIHTFWNNTNDTARIELNASGVPNPTQAGFCAAFGIALHMPAHRENNGCRRVDYSVSDKLFSPNEMQAIRNKYDRGARDPDPDTGLEVDDETWGAPDGAALLTGVEIVDMSGSDGRFGLGKGRYSHFKPDPKRGHPGGQVERSAPALGYQHHCPDDGATGPACMWDARHDGDGFGTSYIYKGVAGHVVHYRHKVVHALLGNNCHRPLPRQRVYWDTIHGTGRIRITRDDRVCSAHGTSYAIQKGRPGPVGTT